MFVPPHAVIIVSPYKTRGGTCSIDGTCPDWLLEQPDVVFLLSERSSCSLSLQQSLGQLLSCSIRTLKLTLNPVSCRAALTPSAPLALMPPPPSGASQPVSVSRLQMQLHLQGLQQNTNALRKQLSQLRNMQVGACRVPILQ